MIKFGLIPFLARITIAISVLSGVMALGALAAGHVLGSGNMVAFLGAQANYTIHLLDADRPFYVNLEGISTLNFAVSPDGQEIAFADFGYTGERGIYVMGTFGTNFHQIAQVQFVPQPLVWSPDSTQVAFLDRILQQNAVSTTSSPSIFVVDVHSGSKRQLTDNPNAYNQLIWSPDGKQITAITYTLQRSQIFTLSVSDGEMRLLTAFEGGAVGDPVWSADGEHLQFIVATPNFDSPSAYANYVIDTDGSHLQMLSQSNSGYYNLDQLPDEHDSPPVRDSNLFVMGEVSWSTDNQWITYPVHIQPPPRTLLASGNVVLSSDGIVISRVDGSDEHILATDFLDITSPVFIPR